MKNIVQSYLEKYNLIKGYFTGDRKRFMFTRNHSSNSDYQDVLLKIGEVKDADLTELNAEYSMANHILSLGINGEMDHGNLDLVDHIASMEINGKNRCFYSFSSKYCNLHNSACFPIVSGHLLSTLVWFSAEFQLREISKQDLVSYKRLKLLADEFMMAFHLTFDYKDLDKFLWLYSDDIMSSSPASNTVVGVLPSS